MSIHQDYRVRNACLIELLEDHLNEMSGQGWDLYAILPYGRNGISVTVIHERRVRA